MQKTQNSILSDMKNELSDMKNKLSEWRNSYNKMEADLKDTYLRIERTPIKFENI